MYGLGEGGVFFYKLTRNLNLTKILFFFLCMYVGGGVRRGKERGRVSVRA